MEEGLKILKVEHLNLEGNSGEISSVALLSPACSLSVSVLTNSLSTSLNSWPQYRNNIPSPPHPTLCFYNLKLSYIWKMTLIFKSIERQLKSLGKWKAIKSPGMTNLIYELMTVLLWCFSFGPNYLLSYFISDHFSNQAWSLVVIKWIDDPGDIHPRPQYQTL